MPEVIGKVIEEFSAEHCMREMKKALIARIRKAEGEEEDEYGCGGWDPIDSRDLGRLCRCLADLLYQERSWNTTPVQEAPSVTAAPSKATELSPPRRPQSRSVSS